MMTSDQRTVNLIEMEGRQQQPALTLPLDGKKSMAELTESRIDSCCNTVEPEEKINPIAECQSSADSDAFSGRMSFMGVDVAFMTIDEHLMFALNEILEKLLPTTPRTTVCTRLERMSATRHLCSKQEVRKMKALGGAKPNAVNCTLIARKHVVQYCDKFKDKLQKETSSGTKKSDVNSTPAYLNNNLQINSPISAAVHVSDETTSKSTSVADNDIMVFGTNGPVEDCLQARKSCEGKCKENTDEITIKATEIQTGKNESDNSAKPSICCDKQSIDSKLSADSVSRCSAGLISQLAERTPAERTVDKCDDEQAQNAFKRFSHLKRKRKRRTNLEILQSFNSEIGSDKILNNKRERKICKAKEDGSYYYYAEKKRQHSSVNLNDTSQNPPTFHLDSAVTNSSNKQSTPQALQALNLEYVVNDESGEKVCYFDQNNNEVDMLPPCSPTLLLKRSMNNEWRIAKTVLPPGFNFDNETEGEKSSESYESLILKAESSSESCVSSSSNIAYSTTSRQQPPVQPQVSSQSTTNLTSNKRKNSKTIGRCALAKKFGRIKKKKETTTMKCGVDEHENKANEVTHPGLNVPPNPNYKTTAFNENHCSMTSIAKAPSSSINVSKNASTNKSKKKYFETTDNGENSKQVNKSNDVVNKSKPRRRMMNAFRLIETLPYPSFLMIKDGDLSPSYTMTYSSTKHIPGCCHPLWRWRLGKPVPLNKQAQTNKSSPGESCDQQVGENYEKERPVVEVENDEVPSKESTDKQTVVL